MASNTFREFIQDQLKEFESFLRGMNKISASVVEERLQGAKDFARFLFGDPFG